MKRLLLVEDIPETVDRFREAFGSRYEIDEARSVRSAIDLVEEKAREYDLFVLDANLPEEDWGRANDPGAWNRIARAIEAKLGPSAWDRIFIRTMYEWDSEAVGRSVVAIPKSLGLDVFEVFMERRLGPPAYCRPSVLMVTRLGEHASKVERVLGAFGADVKRKESASNAIEALREVKQLFHLLVVQLNLPRGKSQSPFAMPQIPPDSLLQPGLHVVTEARLCSPLTEVAVMYPASAIDSGISFALHDLRVSLPAVAILGKDDLGPFIANGLRVLLNHVRDLERLGEQLENGLAPTCSSLQQAVSLLAGGTQSPAHRSIENWLSSSTDHGALLVVSSRVEHCTPLVSGLVETLKDDGTVCGVVDCGGVSPDRVVQRLAGELDRLLNKAEPTALVLRCLSPAILEAITQSEPVASQLRGSPDLRVVVSAEADQATRVGKHLEQLFQRSCRPIDLPQLRRFSRKEVQALVLSYLMALATHRQRTKIRIDTGVYEVLRRELREYTAPELWPVLREAYAHARDISDQSPQLDAPTVMSVISAVKRSDKLPPELPISGIEVPEKDWPVIRRLIIKQYSGVYQISPLGSSGMSGARLYDLRPKYRPPGARRAYKCPSRVVKVGFRRKISEEYKNYREWVKPFQDRNVARIEDRFVEEPPWGAIAYWLVRRSGEGEKLDDFDEYFRDPQTKVGKVRKVIKSLFERVLIPNWYEPSKEDFARAGFNWFYGQHLPPLLEVSLRSKDDVFFGEEPEPVAGDARQEVWSLVDRLCDPDDSIEGELLHLGSLTVPYREEHRSTLISRHVCGAQIAIRIDQSEWDEIRRLAQSVDSEAYPIGVRGSIQSRQQHLLTNVAIAGYEGIVCPSDFQQTNILLAGKMLPNPLLVYQKHLRDPHHTRQFSGIVHGDLHWRNILVENSRSRSPGWLIDFGRTGIGPIVFDAIELETDLLVTILPQLRLTTSDIPDSEQVPDSAQVAAILTDVESRKRRTCPKDPVLDKVRLTIHEIRKCASRYLPNGYGVLGKDWRAYYTGLCLYSLGLLRYFRDDDPDERSRELTNIRRRICFMIAAKSSEFVQRENVRHK